MSGSSGEAQAGRRAKRARRARPKVTLFAWVGIAIIAVNVFIALFGTWLAPYGPTELIAVKPFAPAGGDVGPLGGDTIGRDVLSRLLGGAHLTLGIALASTVLGFLAGMALGYSAAELRGWFDDAVTWLADLFLAFPPILLALIVIAALGSSLPVLIGTIGFITMPRVVRISRALGMNVATLEFVEVARARGESTFSIVVREIWPNTVRPLAVEFGLRMTFAILFLAGLSFLGLGVQPPHADWGSMVRENLPGVLYGAPAALVPACAIGVLTVGINMVVDWLASQSGRDISEELR